VKTEKEQGRSEKVTTARTKERKQGKETKEKGTVAGTGVVVGLGMIVAGYEKG
jgi:hypothetical protein